MLKYDCMSELSWPKAFTKEQIRFGALICPEACFQLHYASCRFMGGPRAGGFQFDGAGIFVSVLDAAESPCALATCPVRRDSGGDFLRRLVKGVCRSPSRNLQVFCALRVICFFADYFGMVLHQLATVSVGGVHDVGV